jgi:hypothetical protein
MMVRAMSGSAVKSLSFMVVNALGAFIDYRGGLRRRLQVKF